MGITRLKDDTGDDFPRGAVVVNHSVSHTVHAPEVSFDCERNTVLAAKAPERVRVGDVEESPCDSCS